MDSQCYNCKDGSEHNLRLPGCSRSAESQEPHVFCVVGNRDKTLFIAVTSSIFYIYLAHPQLLLCSLKRSEENVRQKGEYRKVYWRHDSSAVCFTTSKNCLLLYRLDISYDKQSFNLTEPREEHLRRTSQELFIREKRPKIAAYLSLVARLDSPATCIVPFRDDLFVCLQNGWLHRISWEGVVDKNFSFHLLDVPFAVDQLQSKTEHVQESDAHVVDMAYAPLIGGFCVVLSNGTAALLTSPSSKFLPKELLGVWAMQLTDAVCTAANHKYRLVVYGCRNGDIAAFHLDDANGSLTYTFRVTLHVKNGPELLNRLGHVRHVECYAQGTALAAVWSPLLCDEGHAKNSSSIPVVAIFSSFGAQLWCSLESSSDRNIYTTNSYHWVDWGPEGFSLWLAADIGLCVLPIAHSVNTSGVESTDRVIFLSGSHIYLSAAKEREQSVSAPHSIWHVLSIPNSYLSFNWPIRLVEMDDHGQWLVVAGARGFIHYNLAACKWRMFGNESQERDMLVTGGMTIWGGYVVIACYDIDRSKEELRFYPLENQLNNHFCIRHSVNSRILLLSRRQNKLITFDVDSCIFIFILFLEKNPKKEQSFIRIDRCAEIRVHDIVPHAACVLSVEPAFLNHDSQIKFCNGVDTVFMNVCGGLIMLNPVKPDGVASDSSDDDGTSFQLSRPMLIASYVEQIWYDTADEGDSMFYHKPHLIHALWLNCGAKGMKVWMPLFTARHTIDTKYNSSHSFISKRIMLPFELDIAPLGLLFYFSGVILEFSKFVLIFADALVICSRDCLAIGVESCPAYSDKQGSRKHLPIYNLHRKSEVFLHHLLRQLLKRNLGVYALEIAATCNGLPYFGHVLELLLHNVLEEEAISSEPIPDPLLPRVVAFIQEFPNYLQTIAHCARKTELALWPALFAVTGHPRELFEKCISDGQLETAVSFLIILQNMESSSASQEHATILLGEALSKRQWLTARDIVRFLRAIDPSDIDDPSRTPPCQKPHRNVVNVVSRIPTCMSTNDSEETDSFVFGSYTAPGMIKRPRPSQQDGGCNSPPGRKESTGKKVLRISSSDAPLSPTNVSGSVATYLDDVLNQHATHLLEDCSIQDLGAFAAYLDFNLVKWLRVQRQSIGRINDFALALMRLHAQFKWPYPLVSQSIVDQLTKRIEGIKISPSNASLDSLQSLSTANSNVSLSTEEQQRSTLIVCGDSNSVSVDDGEEKNELPRMCRQSTLSTVSAESLSNSGSDWEGFEKICGEVAARGTQESELELKYMLDVMYEAGCASWTLLLCLLRRDVSFLSKHFSQKFVQSCGPDTINELHKGLEQLQNWASNSCFGYRTLIDAYKRHLAVIGSANGGRIVTELSPVLPGCPSSSLLPTSSSHVEMNGISISENEVLLVTDRNPSTLRRSSLPDDCTARNGIIHKVSPVQTQQLSTSAAMDLVKKAFTPPRENGEIGDSYAGIGSGPVVSNAAVDGRDQCNLM
uniref:Protein RIC1 homolog n=1 Tax=Setaria digitata TaxID=48799 RepID=A0A915Q7R5_9BILA